jgi:hypothetical protein
VPLVALVDLNELERELCRIPEVTAARVVAGASGLIEEVHILSLPLKHAKQVVRDVQSVAMASFGLDLDRRIVSVVQLEAPAGTVAAPVPPPPVVAPEPEPEPDPQVEVQADLDPALAALAEALDVSITQPPPRPPAAEPEPERRQALTATVTATAEQGNGVGVGALNGVDTRINVDTVNAIRNGHQCTTEVVLSRGHDRATGTAEGIVATSSVLRLVAQATLLALRLLEPAALRADVEAAMVVHLGSRQVALTTVVLVVPPYEEVCAGSAVVRVAGELDAVARAVLDATNRRLPQLR